MLRFISEDGSFLGVRVENAETGEDLTKSLSIMHGAQITMDLPDVTARVELCVVQADAVAGRTDWLTKHPIDGAFKPLAAIEFRDGTRVEFAEDGTPRIAPRPAAA